MGFVVFQVFIGMGVQKVASSHQVQEDGDFHPVVTGCLSIDGFSVQYTSQPRECKGLYILDDMYSAMRYCGNTAILLI